MRFILITAFVVVLFLPYQYEAGGPAVVYPVLQQEIYAENQGIVNKVYWNGGEWLQKGVLIAEMENYRQKQDVELTLQAISKKRQEIEILLTTPSVEEVEVARQQLLTSKLKLDRSKDDFQRIEKLYNQDYVSLVDYLNAEKDMELNQQEVLESKANLLAIKNQVNIHSIESAKIELATLKKELQFHEEQLERTKLLMPNDGKIVTMNLKNLEKKFLDEGQFIAAIENSKRVQIEILVPELDIGHVTIGDKMNFKAEFYPNKIINGKITSIYPVTESTDIGTMLKVVGVIPNEDGILKTGMTGYAKIEGEEMFVIQAFTKALTSFFLIEFWSWLP